MSTPKPFWTVQVNLNEDEYLIEVFFKSFVFASSFRRRYLSSFHNRLYQIKSYPDSTRSYTANTIYPKFEKNIPRNETARPQSHIHVSVKDLYIPTIGHPIVLQENRWTDRENI